MFCPQCGANVPNSASFCSSCGSALSQSTPAYQAQPVVVTQVYQNPTSGYQQGNYGYAANQWQPATTPELGGPARKIDTNRGILKYLIFTLLTFGIYGMWFIYKMAQDMNTMCEDDDQNTGGLLAFILLSFITLGIYAIYWWYKIAERTYVNAPRYGLMISEKGSNFLLWYILGIITFGICALFGMHIVLRNVNSLAAAYNRVHGFV